MEIREGIKFKDLTCDTEFTIKSIINNDKINIVWDNGNVDYTLHTIKRLFKENSWKLTYYPYQIGDWIKVIQKCAFEGEVIQISDFYDNGFHKFKAGGVCFARTQIRPAFEDEIPKEQLKFIPGKWYKIFDSWYAKFECIHNSGKYWRFSENIALHTGYSNKEHQFDDWKDISIIELTDLSEIQQYLPDGHINKLPKSCIEAMKPIQEEYDKTSLAIQQELLLFKQELLLKARRDYPIGTKFKSVITGNINIVKSDCKFTGDKNEISVDTDIWKTNNMQGTPIYTRDGKWAEIVEEDLEVFVAPKGSKIILPNKTENMNDLEKELKERESKIDDRKSDIKLGWYNPEPIYSTSNTIKPNLIKHNNSRFQKLLIIRTNKNKSKGI